MSTRFQDVCVLVTGAGHGIGRAVAERFAAEGARVGVNDIERASAQEIVDAIEAAGGTALALVGDVGSEEDVTRVAAAVVDAYGPVDVLVNNAALAHVRGRRPALPRGRRTPGGTRSSRRT